jgi:hypothetical protein
MSEQPTPVAEDAHATPAQLLARARTDYTNARTAARKKQQQGGTGRREGVLHGENH